MLSPTLTPTVVWGPAVGDIGEISSYTQKAEGLLFHDGKIQRLAPKDFAKQSTYEGDFKYAGVDDNYFMTVRCPRPGEALIPAAGDSAAGRLEGRPRELVSYSIEPKHADAPGKFFAGPKDFDVLAAIDRDLTRAINFGMFAVIVVPLLRSLKWVNGFVGNYGWSIIILTIIINADHVPAAPQERRVDAEDAGDSAEVKAIQDRYAKLKATDPAKQKMNQELMALYASGASTRRAAACRCC